VTARGRLHLDEIAMHAGFSASTMRSTEKPNKAGTGLIFISLSVDVPGDQIHAEIEALDRLGVELEGKGRASLERPARLRVEAAGIRSGI
jgi:hypothetical protein